ncbi:MAG: serine/threonine-protein kinase [Cyanobacteriota/Melainabacteria group bacterium]
MSGLIDDSICKVCLQPKEGSTSGRITQWVSICRCATAASEEELFSSLKICSKCYKRINLSRHGSFTQWIFRTDFCNCYQPQLTSEGTEVESQEVRSFNDIDYPELEMDEEDTDFPYQRFKPVEILGQGAIGRVYRCQDRLLQKVVAVKVMQALQPQQVVSFQKEARLTAQLNHPNIIQIIDINITDRGTPYIVLEYVPGVSLRDYLTQGGPLDWKSALQLTEQILEALVYAHDKGIYHRDLKPENILLTRDEQNEFLVKLIDFGIALDAASEDADGDVEFQGKTFTGTPPYMSPDQAGGFSFDQKSEIYSVGCILFELLTGTKPFAGDTALEILSHQTQEEPPDLDNYPEIAFLNPLLHRALSKSREARFESTGEFLKVLKEVYDSEFGSEPETTTVPSEVPRSKLVPTAVGLMALVALTASFLWLAKKDDSKDSFRKQLQAKKAAKKAFSSIILDSKLGGLKPGTLDGEFAANQLFDDNDMKALQNRKDIKVLFLKNSMISGASLKYLTGCPISHLILTGINLEDNDLVPLGQKMSIASLGLGRTGIAGESLGLFKTMQGWS